MALRFTHTEKECMVACRSIVSYYHFTYIYVRSCVEFMIVDDIVD